MPRRLVVQLARFGDLLQSKRLVRSLVQRGETHLCVDRSLVSLARLVYPEVHVHGLSAHGQGASSANLKAVFTENRSVFAELSALEWGEVYNLNFSGLNLALSTLFPPEIIRGHRQEKGQPLRDTWSDMAFRWTRRRQASPLNLVDFWAWLTGPYSPPMPGSKVNPAASPKGGGLGVVLAGRDARRSLPMDVLVPLVHAAMQGTGAKRCTLLGSKAERPAARAFLRQAPAALHEACTDLCGKTDWSGLQDAVQGLDLLVTPDTGTMHLAAHLGTPVLACFLSSAWVYETGPYGQGHVTLQTTEECAPCVESRPCNNDLACLAPFRAKETLRALATGLDFAGRGLPTGLGAVGNAFDDLGQTCQTLTGEDRHVEYRLAQRGLLAEYLLGSQRLCEDSGRLQQTAQRLYQERDWLLPAERFAPSVWE